VSLKSTNTNAQQSGHEIATGSNLGSSTSENNLSNKSPAKAHLPVLDGIRGVAILMVLIFHSTLLQHGPWIDTVMTRVGLSLWVGVDLFFVLSGFLITSILLDAKGSSSYYKSFFARRILRIFPLYYLLVVFALFIAPKIGVSNSAQFEYAWREQWWYWTYLSNFLAAQHGLRHLILSPSWSLAIEEQFYLFWPFVVACVSQRKLLRISLSLIVLAFLLRVSLFYFGYSGKALYVLTPTRIDTLAVGATIAILIRDAANHQTMLWTARVLFVLCGAFTTIMLFSGHINKKLGMMINYGYTIIAFLFGSALVLLLNCSPTSILYRIFSSKTLAVFGMYSYGIYLVNRPLVELLHNRVFDYRDFPRLYGSRLPGQFMFTLLLIASSFAIAFLLYHLFEKHFLKLKRYFPK